MELIAWVVGTCVVVVVLSLAVLMASRRLRWGLNVRLTNLLERERAREVYVKVYDFTTSIPAKSVTDAIEQRWGRAVTSDEPQFYVHSVIYERQVILRFCNQATPKIFSARIDFESANPAAGVLHFFDADDHDLIGAADQLRADFNRFIKDLSPGSGFKEHQGPLIIATLDPATSETYQPRKPGQHRRRKP